MNGGGDGTRDSIETKSATPASTPGTQPSLRTVPIPEVTLSLLTRLQEQAPDGFAYVFLTPGRFEAVKAARDAGENVDKIVLLRGIQSRFPKLVKKAAEAERTLLGQDGKPSVTLHDLRRSCITNWTNRIPMQAASVLAGHSSITTTARFYAATTAQQRERARDAASAAIEALSEPTRAKLAQTTPTKDKAVAATTASSDATTV